MSPPVSINSNNNVGSGASSLFPNVGSSSFVPNVNSILSNNINNNVRGGSSNRGGHHGFVARHNTSCANCFTSNAYCTHCFQCGVAGHISYNCPLN